MNVKESVFTIPVGEAAGYTKAWRDQKHFDPNYAKAFTVKIQELEDVLTELKTMPMANAIRVYLAKKPNPNGPGEIETIILCGVDGFYPEKGLAGFDIVRYVPTAAKDAGAEEVSGCYDFNYPCPDTCAQGDSPLLNDN